MIIIIQIISSIISREIECVVAEAAITSYNISKKIINNIKNNALFLK